MAPPNVHEKLKDPMRIDRRSFLVLMSAPAMASLIQACDRSGHDDGSGGDGFRFVGSTKARAGAPAGSANDAARALNRLGGDLYGRLSAATANLVFSPASIMIALAMTRAGAVGRTASEMDAVLHSSEAGSDESQFHVAMNALIAALQARSGIVRVDTQDQEVELSVVNSLWGQDGVTWKSPFLDVLAGDYGAGMRLVDYAARTEDARKAINRWVSRQTRARIPELLEPGSLTPDIVLTLVNAIHMKAPWLVPFPETGTRDGAFTTLDGTAVSVPFMHASLETSYVRGPDWQALDIPYVGGALAMMLIVPDGGALSSVESRLTEGLVPSAVADYREATVNLGLPKFEMETKLDLRETMALLGMPTAFLPGQANFTAMTDDEQLFISFIVHQANITVDEKGTEAAAATAVGMGRTAAPSETVTLEIDRPFLFVVRDVPTGAVLFLGRVGDPR